MPTTQDIEAGLAPAGIGPPAAPPAPPDPLRLGALPAQQPSLQIVDRQEYLRQQQAAAQARQQILQQRERALQVANPLLEARARYSALATPSAPNLPPNPSLVPDQNATLTAAQQDQVRRFGRLLTPTEEIEQGYRKARNPFGPIEDIVQEPLPYAKQAAELVGQGAGLASRGLSAIENVPGLGTNQQVGTLTDEEKAQKSEQFGTEVGKTVIPQTVGQAALELTPGIGAVPGGASAIRKAIAEGGLVADEYLASEAGQQVLQRLAADAGSSTPGDTLLGLDRLLQSPAFLKRAPNIHRAPFLPEYLMPPALRRLGGRSPEEALAEAQANTQGKVLRGIGEKTADVLNPISEATTGGRRRIGTSIANWASKESQRLQRSVAEAVTQYNRNVSAGTKWAHEQGARLGESMDAAFGARPDQPFRSRVTSTTIKIVGDDGRIHELTNLDVAENWGHLADYLTREQVAVAKQHGEFMAKIRGAARADGVAIGDTIGPYGHVDAYVPRPALLKDDKPFYTDSARGLAAEEARDYKSQAEGIANGVTYPKSWVESYSPHLSSVQRRRAELELKKWTDIVGETPTERMLRLAPNEVAERGAARQSLARAENLTKRMTSEVRRNTIKTASQAVRAADYDVRTAERQLAAVTSAPQLDRPVKDALINRVGKARETLAARTADLKAATNDALDSLKGYVAPEDSKTLENVKQLEDFARTRDKSAGKAYLEAKKRAFNLDATKEVMSPRGTIGNVTQGRVFSVEDAKFLEQATPSEQSFLGAVWQAAQMPFRIAKLTLDLSAGGVQGWTTLMSRPFVWARSVTDGILMTANPRLRAQILDRDTETLRWAFKNMPEAIDNNPDFIQSGKLLNRFGQNLQARVPATKLISKPLGIVDHVFRDTRTALAINLARSMKDMAKNPDEEYELGSAILKLVGISRTTGPEKDILLAANQVRALIGTALDAGTHSGVQGKVARQTLMRAYGAAAAATLAWQFSHGERDPRELAKSITPGETGAFTIAGVNLLGTYAPYLRTLADLGGASKDFAKSLDVGQLGSDVAGGQGALTQLGRSKLNPVLGGGVSGLTGRDYLGRPTDLQTQFASPESLTPISVESLKQQADRSNFWVAVPAIVLGARYTPPSAYRDLTDTLKNLNIPANDFFEPGTRAKLIAEHPELQGKYDAWRESRKSGTVEQQQSEKIIRDKTTAIQKVLDTVRSGQLTPDTLRSKIGDINTEANTLREALLPDPAEKKQVARLDPLYALYDAPENQLPEGGPDFQKVHDAIEAKLKEHPELREPWDANQHVPVTSDPIEIALKNAQRLVDSSSLKLTQADTTTWFGLKDELWKMLVASTPAFQKYPTFNDYARAEGLASLGAGFDIDKLASIDPVAKTLSDVTKTAHQAMLAQDPRLGAALRVFYGVNLPDTDLPPQVQAALAKETADLYASLGIQSPS